MEWETKSFKYCSEIANRLETRFDSDHFLFGKGTLGNSAVGYSFNSEGFRSDEFAKCSKDVPSVLFAGCSVTYGFGLELEQTYAYRVHEYLANKGLSSGFFSVAVPAYSSIQSILSIFDYIDLYGDPSMIVLLMPPLERDAAYFLNYSFEGDYKAKRSQKDQFSDFNKFFPFFFRIYKRLYMYCKKNNIKLVSGHWDESFMAFEGEVKNPKLDKYSMQCFLEQTFKGSYKPIVTGDFIELIFNYKEDNKKEKNLLIADDNDHPGSAWQYAINQRIIKEFEL
jgi:hypothetical protein